MDQKEAKSPMGRRDFLKAATVGGVSAAVVVATSKDAGAADVTVDAEAKKGGYSETGHVAKYYELANI